MNRSRYADLATFADVINGREVSIPELPERAEVATLRNGFAVMSKPPEGEPFDLVAHNIGLDEDAALVLAAVNDDVAPDPLEIPQGVSLAIPSPARIEEVMQGASVKDL